MIEIGSEGFSSSTHLNSIKLTKEAKEALARYVMKYAQDELLEMKLFLLFSALKSLIVKFETIFGGCSDGLENYDRHSNSIWKHILIDPSRTQAFVHESLGSTEGKQLHLGPN